MRSRRLAAVLPVAALLAAPGCRAQPAGPIATAPAPERTVETAGPEAPAPDPAASVEPTPIRERAWQFGTYAGVIVESEHFRIHTTIESPRSRDRLALFFEGALDRYTTEFGPLPRPTRPMETYVFADRRQWQAKTRQLLPDQASQFANLGSGGYTTRGIAVLYELDGSDTYAIAAHEGWHQYTQTVFANQLPIWLEEGLAACMEVIRLNRDGTTRFRIDRNLERWYALRRNARSDRLIPLDELLAGTPQMFLERSKSQLLLYYAQVWALARYIQEGENGRFAPLLREALSDAVRGDLAKRLGPRRGVRSGGGPAFITNVLGTDLDEFEAGYQAYVAELVAPRFRTAGTTGEPGS